MNNMTKADQKEMLADCFDNLKINLGRKPTMEEVRTEIYYVHGIKFPAGDAVCTAFRNSKGI